jgi:hypothetical protein
VTVNIHIEYILCSKKIYDNDNEVLAEYCFIVDEEWLMHMWNRHFKKLFGYDDFQEFLDEYDPDYEGQIIYMVAKQHNRIIDEGYEAPDID